MTISSGLARRDWLKQTASLVGSAAAAGAMGGVTDAAEQAAPTPAPVVPTVPAASAPRTVIAPSTRNIVETSAGRVRGFVRNGVLTFRGVPYAGSTAGAARFMAPTKIVPWAGVRSSMAQGFACPQAFHVPEGRRPGWSHDEEAFMFEWDDGVPGEDCLRLNVWTPNLTGPAKRPVMVWIHGGGYTSGSSNELRMYDGESLAKRGDVVVVSLNHRLGALGYMNLLEYGEKWANAVNVGQLDLVAALDWVRENISLFGGDATRVMVFGQSGGGSKIGTLMGMPSAKGLFHRAAIQSGSTFRQTSPDRSSALAAATLQELGITRGTIDKLQDVPAEAIVSAGVRAQRKLQATARPTGGSEAIDWGPTVDGRSIPRHTWDPAAPEYSATVPLLVGSVLNETGNSIQAANPALDAMSLDDLRAQFSAERGAKSEEILAVFQRKFPKATPYEILSRITGMTARSNAVAQATLKAEQGTAAAYLYWFQWQTPVLDGRPRAFHGAELPFVFANTDRCAAMTGGGGDARVLAGKIADAWVAFARTGKPGHAGLPVWPAFSPTVGQTMVFDSTSGVKNNPDREERDVLRG